MPEHMKGVFADPPPPPKDIVSERTARDESSLEWAEAFRARLDPADWIEVPGGFKVHRADMNPCRQCGSRTFEIRSRDGRRSISCPRCMPIRPDSKIIARIDVATGRITDDATRGGTSCN